MPVEQLIQLGSVRPIVRWGTPVMHRRTEPVTDFGSGLQSLLADMFATNTAAEGAGLAATQVGVSLAAFVYDCFDADYCRQVGVMCNPVVILDDGSDRRLETWDEGCLSLPGGYAPLARPGRAVCVGQDQFGDHIELVGTGQLARCFQHETDHLHGTVVGDRLSSKVRRQLYATHAVERDRYPADWPVSAAGH